MIMVKTRTITAILLLLSMYLNTVFANTIPLPMEDPNSVFYDPEYTEQLSQLSESEINEGLLTSMLEFQMTQCMDENQNISYSKKVTIERDGTTEVIDCAEVAAVHFEIMTEGEGIDDRQALACVTEGWHIEDRLAFAKELNLNLEEVMECPGKNTSDLKCMGEFACGALQGIGQYVPGALPSKWVADWAKKSFNMDCKGGNTLSSIGNCLSEVLWGIIKNVIGSLEFLADGIKWVGRKLCFWCEDEHEDASSDQQHVINSSEAIRDHNTRQSDAAEDESKALVENFFSGMKNVFNKLIAEPAGQNFGCAEWEGNRFSNIESYNIFDSEGGVPVRCNKPLVSWKCGTCDQRLQVMCGVVGFIGGEVITSILTGKIVATVAQVVTKVGGVTMRAARSLPVLNRVGNLGRGAVLFLKDSNLGKYAFKIGNKSVPLTAGFRSRLVDMFTKVKMKGVVAKRAIFDSNFVGRGVKGYFNLLDDAFMYGMSGRAGLMANRAARVQSRVKNSMALAGEKFKDYQDLAAAMTTTSRRVEQTLVQLEDTLKNAKNATGPAKQQLLDEAKRLGDEYTALARQFDNEYKTALQNLDARKAEEARLAAAERERQQAAQAAQSAQDAQRNSSGQAVALSSSNNVNTAASSSSRTASNTIQSSNRQITGSSSANQRRIANEASSVPASTNVQADIYSNYPRGWNGERNLTSPEIEDVINGTSRALGSDNDLRLYVYDRNTGERLGEVWKPVAESGELRGLRPDGQAISFKLDDVGDVEAVASYSIAGNMAKNRVPLNFSEITNPTVREIAQRSSAPTRMTTEETLAFGRELHALSRQEIRQLGSQAVQRLLRGEQMTQAQFIAYAKTMPGWITKERLPNADVISRAFNTSDTSEAMRILDEGIVGTSDVTNMIRESLKTALTADIELRAPNGLIAVGGVAGQGVVESNILSLTDNTPRRLPARANESNLPAIRSSSDNLPVPAHNAENVIIPPTPLLNRGDEPRLLTAPVRAPTLRINRAGTLFAGANTFSDASNNLRQTGGGSSNNEDIITPADTTPSYQITTAIDGEPKVCSAQLQKKVAPADFSDMTPEQITSEGIVIKWFKAAEYSEENQICNSASSCQFPADITNLYITAHKGDSMIASINCTVDEIIVTADREPADDDDLPYDIPSDNDGIDRAEEFYQQQRHPAPSMFQPIRIPSRNTQYMGTGYF